MEETGWLVMLKIKVCLLSFVLFYSSLSASDFLKSTYSFSNLSMNYLDWSSQTEERTNDKDFSYLEYEGGSGYQWGEIYTFVDVRNPTKNYNDDTSSKLAFAVKPTVDIKIKDTFAIHIQDYHLQSKPYHTNDAIVGFSYKLTTKFNFWTKPFIGYHYKTSTYYSGKDGYMFGWLLNYKYRDFSLFQWHEMTFDRDTKDGYGKHIGVQGAVKFWYNMKSKVSLGIQYRYASYELGNKNYQWGTIYSVKYNF